MALAGGATAGATDGSGALGSVGAYAVAVAVTVAAILSQYVVPELVPSLAVLYGPYTGLLVVYGIPILSFAVLVGARPLAGWASHLRTASIEGLRWYGLLSILALGVTIVLAIVYAAVDPSALRLLSRPNPVLENARSDPWFWVAFSFVIGAIEETIFRGWIFGYWLARRSPRWTVHAVWTSALFASVHLYYGTTYGPAAPFIYPTLFLLGLAFALTVRASGGNLMIVALLHGANDAAAFLELISPDGGLAVHYGVIGIGLAVALVLYLRSRPPPLAPVAVWGAGGPPGLPVYAWPIPPPPPPSAPPPGAEGPDPSRTAGASASCNETGWTARWRRPTHASGTS